MSKNLIIDFYCLLHYDFNSISLNAVEGSDYDICLGRMRKRSRILKLELPVSGPKYDARGSSVKIRSVTH
jgi:hypothetical protein